MLNSHQSYLEAPYAAQDAEQDSYEHWEEHFAPSEYNRLVESDNIDGTTDEDDDFTPLPFEDWLRSRQGESAYEEWADDMRYGY